MSHLDDMRAKLRPKFIAQARQRIARIQGEGTENARREMHSLAGEAAMMGELELSARARDAEQAAVAWLEGEDGEASAAAFDAAFQAVTAIVRDLA